MTVYKFVYTVYADNDLGTIVGNLKKQDVPPDIAEGLSVYFRDWEVQLGCTYDTETEELTIENHA